MPLPGVGKLRLTIATLMRKILEGFAHFQRHIYPKKKDLFQQLAQGQTPLALFITCSDSRIVPDLVTQTAPGELFISRNAGNIVPPYGELAGGVSATIEYAVSVLKIPNVIICGHSDCGAMKAALNPESIAQYPVVSSWLRHADGPRRVAAERCAADPNCDPLHIITHENILAQIDHLRTHPCIMAALARGELSIYGWLYDIAAGHMDAWDADRNQFVPLEEHVPPAVRPRIAAPSARAADSRAAERAAASERTANGKATMSPVR